MEKQAMTPPLQPDPAEIARGLSDNQSRFLPQLKRRGFSIHPGRQSKAVRGFLRDSERDGLLINPSFDNYFLTPLGIAVRAIIEQEGK